MFKVRLRLMWHPQPQFAGALMAQHYGIASAWGVNLDCQPPDFNETPVEAVLRGNSDLCVASPSHLFESEDPAALKFLLTFQQESPLIYLAHKKHGIATIKDLSGKRIAVWPGEEDLELQWMLHKEGVDLNSIERVHAVDTVRPLLEEKVSCAQVTCYNEYHEFLEQGGNADSVCHFVARENGTDLIKDGICARKGWLDESPERAQQVVNCLLEGWTQALLDQALTINLCKELRPEIEKLHYKIQYNDIKRLVLSGATLTHGLGFPALEHVVRAAKAIREVDKQTLKVIPQDCVSAEYWHAAPAQIRGNNWK